MSDKNGYPLVPGRYISVCLECVCVYVIVHLLLFIYVGVSLCVHIDHLNECYLCVNVCLLNSKVEHTINV